MGGIALLGVLPIGLSSESISLAVVFATLGSLLPDLDARESKLSNVQIGGMTLVKPLARALNRRLGHRGPLHSLMALLVIALFVALPLSVFLNPFAGIGLALGYLSHLLLDAFTKSGVPLYWPDAGRVWLLPPRLRVTTGSAAEDVFFLLLTFVAAAFLLIHLFQFPNAASPLITSP